jgi:glycosyltransferase involved in cell wall biosynthesis
MPCPNEAETLAQCIEKARLGIQRSDVRGEIIAADNGSTDGSQAIAEKLGARVVPVKGKGYGSALRGGINAASGTGILMGGDDDSCDFSEITGFVKKFREGFELVMGCRLPMGDGTIMPGAMPWKNRWIGNLVLSFIRQLFSNARPAIFRKSPLDCSTGMSCGSNCERPASIVVKPSVDLGFACYFLDFEGGGEQSFRPDAPFVHRRWRVGGN